jgi:acetoin utilization protein AcuC
MAGDPIGGLAYSESFYSNVAKVLHRVAHDTCKGRMVALGGGGYDVDNCARAWTSVVGQMVAGSES